MYVSAHRSMVLASPPPPDPPPPVDPENPDGPGPKPPPRIHSALALSALVSQLATGYPQPGSPEAAPGPLERHVRKSGTVRLS